MLYKNILTEKERTNLIYNIIHSLGACRQDIRENMIRLFYKVDEDYGKRVEQGIISLKEEGTGLLDKLSKVIGFKSEKSSSTSEDLSVKSNVA